ncbi:uncharacterized protein [Aristolochia californica]
MRNTTAEAVQPYPGSPSAGRYSSSSLCDAAIVEAANNINTKRCTRVKKLATQKRKAYPLCFSRFKKRRVAAAAVNRTHLGNLILRRVLLLEARKRFLAHRLKHMAATVDTVRSELQPVKEETKRALDQLLSIKRKNDNGNTCSIINGSLEEKLKSLLERCAGKEEEVLNTTKAIQ